MFCEFTNSHKTVISLMRSSHHRHGQDKTRQDCVVLSCLVRVCGVRWVRDSLRQFSVALILET